MLYKVKVRVGNRQLTKWARKGKTEYTYVYGTLFHALLGKVSPSLTHRYNL